MAQINKTWLASSIRPCVAGRLLGACLKQENGDYPIEGDGLVCQMLCFAWTLIGDIGGPSKLVGISQGCRQNLNRSHIRHEIECSSESDKPHKQSFPAGQFEGPSAFSSCDCGACAALPSRLLAGSQQQHVSWILHLLYEDTAVSSSKVECWCEE